MWVKGIIDEDFINYKLPSMVIACPKCSFKCGKGLCQNSPLAVAPTFRINNEEIARRFLDNPISEAIVFQGLEPFDTPEELHSLIHDLRLTYKIMAPIVIYTGYTEEEIAAMPIWNRIKNLNIIVKYGRYVPNQKPHYDEILGVNLASDNQYAIDYRVKEIQ